VGAARGACSRAAEHILARRSHYEIQQQQQQQESAEMNIVLSTAESEKQRPGISVDPSQQPAADRSLTAMHGLTSL
jgi:hypothetical protein